MSGEKSYFRSEEMSLCQIYIKKDAAYSCISELGEIGLVHFNNLTEGENAQHLKFAKEMSHCSELERIVRYIRSEVNEAGIKIPELPEENNPEAPQRKEMMELRTLMENIETEMLDIIRNHDALKHKYFNLLEIDAVLTKADEFFQDASILAWSDSLTKTLLIDTNDLKGMEKKGENIKLGYLTGTIPIENFFAFERVLWRLCRGNFFIRHAEIEHMYHDEEIVKKFVFMVFFQGDVIEKKVRKICQGFQTVLYQCPESSRDRLKQLKAMDVKIKDLQIIIEQTDYHRHRVLSAAAADLSLWIIKVKKVTAVYYILNQMNMDEGERYLIAECWVPTTDVSLVQQTLYRGAIKAGSSVPPIITHIKNKSLIPPTYNRTNRITYGFQMLVDAYGVSNYRELNPTPYTIITFPFLFAIMFGDLGHGILVTLFATWMVMKEKMLLKKKINNEIWTILFGGRYIILALGIFSMYTGFIYNDVFSKSLNIFGSSWKVKQNRSTVLSQHEVQLNPTNAFDTPYFIGIDPVWGASGETAIVTLNSFKMKVAIILGVTHMFFGMILAAFNHIFFKNYIDLVGMCIPQMIFFCIFLYLGVLIFLKWSWYSGENPAPYNIHCAPSILITFIDMILFKNSGPMDEGCERYMFQNQSGLQTFVVFLALFCVPIMLLAKPLYIMWKRKRDKPKDKHKPLFKPPPPPEKRVTFSNSTKYTGSDDVLKVRIVLPPSDIDAQSSSSSYSIQSEDETPKEEWNDQDLSEIFIHQGIHTIENVLGSVSHTASYLRLWALSLAHEQLSNVLWKMVLRKGLMTDDWKGGIFVVFTFSIWAVLTVSILVVMEGLSAFLHTLRLHWVEFQSKFYAGSGILFQPFEFKKVLAVPDDSD